MSQLNPNDEEKAYLALHEIAKQAEALAIQMQRLCETLPVGYAVTHADIASHWYAGQKAVVSARDEFSHLVKLIAFAQAKEILVES